MAASEEVADPASVPLALAFEVIRRHRQGLLEDPRKWIEIIVGAASPSEILAEAAVYLGDDRPVDLSRWVMDDLPSREAHFIDDRGDLIRAALISMTLATDPEQQDLGLRVTRSIAPLWDRIRSELELLKSQSQQLGADYGISLVDKRLDVLETSLTRAFAEYERASRGRLRTAAVDRTRAEEWVRRHLEVEWRSGFPRTLLDKSTREDPREWRKGVEYLGIRRLELKEFFTDSGLDEDTMAMMGSAWARAFLAGESNRLFERLGKLPPRSWRIPTIHGRLERANRALGSATHMIAPADWRLWEALDPSLAHGPRYDDGRVGRVLGLEAYETWEEIDSIFVLRLPDALRVRQWLFRGSEFRIEIRAIEGDTLRELQAEGVNLDEPASDTPEERLQTRVLVDLREAIDIRVVAGSAVRVEIPAGLRD